MNSSPIFRSNSAGRALEDAAHSRSGRRAAVALRRDLLGRLGVVHDGRIAYGPACDALARFRASGGTVVLVSNSPSPGDAIVAILDEKQVRRDCYDAIVSSGDLTIAYVQTKAFARVHHVGPLRRDAALFGRLPAHVPLEVAEAIVISGLVDDRRERPEDYLGLVESGLAHGLPLVCANPDLSVHVGADLLPCAGSVAKLYADAGGFVYWAGKPYLPAFETAHARVAEIRGARVERERILMIGDAVRTDIAGAAAFGIDALFVAGGLHRDALLRNGALDEDALQQLFADGAPPAVGAMSALRW